MKALYVDGHHRKVFTLFSFNDKFGFINIRTI